MYCFLFTKISFLRRIRLNLHDWEALGASRFLKSEANIRKPQKSYFLLSGQALTPPPSVLVNRDNLTTKKIDIQVVFFIVSRLRKLDKI